MKAPIITVLALGGLLLAGGGLYQVKRDVEAKRDRVADLSRQIAEDRDAIRTLVAEKAYLSTPARLEEAMKAMPDYAPLHADQVILGFDAIAFRLDPDAPVEEAEDLLPEQPRRQPAAPFVNASVQNRDHLYLIELAERRR